MVCSVLYYVGYAEGVPGLELGGEYIDRTQDRVGLIDDPVDRVRREQNDVLGERW